jgi:hypothetical protein
MNRPRAGKQRNWGSIGQDRTRHNVRCVLKIAKSDY